MVEKEKEMTIAEVMRKMRGAMNLTRKQMAYKLGMEYRRYNKIESGINGASESTLEKMSLTFGIPYHALLICQFPCKDDIIEGCEKYTIQAENDIYNAIDNILEAIKE
jgi:transcriptional regulator with XRE-family HTH domain